VRDELVRRFRDIFVGTMPDADQSRLCHKTAVVAAGTQHAFGGQLAGNAMLA